MIYLDIINAYGSTDRYMRVRDDRFPGKETLIPVEELEKVPVNNNQTLNNEPPLALIPGESLMEPF